MNDCFDRLIQRYYNRTGIFQMDNSITYRLAFSPDWSCCLTFREVSFFIGRGGPLKIFQVLWIFSDPPTVWVKFFWSPPEVLQNLSDPPPQPHNKSGRISFCIWSWDWPSLGLVKSEGREFKRNFNSCSNKTTKFASYQYLLHDW